ncbi:type II toxin-antitoxin system VapC family toxin [Agaribacter flavus]|uniref:Type II toxin-antitoxin system VapC family toxin n=1 Tax=Agaribacter flavus TaxID=1902781 RepID=A0ABV7FL66_9ALTE
MNILLDTHVFIWLNTTPEQLSSRALAICESLDNELYLSMASAWEMSIKASLGKLTLPIPWDVMLKRQQQENGLRIMDITVEHLTHTLPRHHGDPFDRLLLSQSVIEGMPLISRDSQFTHYNVDIIW